jgi:pilus assembly protein CpaE
VTATQVPQHALMTPPDPPREPARPNVRVVTVFSAKGGAGATTVATNLALALQLRGVRVCILDLALAFGDVAVSLQLAPQRTVVDALELGTSREALNELVTSHPSGLDCILAPVDPSGAERMPPATTRLLTAALRERYDVVVIDTASELSEHVLEAFDAADRLVLVTTPEIPAIKNTRIALDVLDLVGHPRERRRVLLNRADPSLGLTVEDIEEALGCIVSAQVPADPEVSVSVNTGVSLVAAQPAHPVSRAVQDFAVREVLGADQVIRADTGRARWRRRSA